MADNVSYRGKTITRDDVLKAMGRFDKDIRESFPQKRWVTYAIEHEGKLYPPKETLRMTGIEDVGGGGEPVNSRFRDLGFRIVNIREVPDVEPPVGDGQDEDSYEASISLERDLEAALIANLGQLEPGLQLYNENDRSGQQFDTQAVGRIDIMALDKDGNIVVIELKAGEADDRVCGQLLRYVGWVKEKLAANRTVRGIIVANEFNERLKYAAKAMSGVVSLQKYEVCFRFSNVT